MSTAKQWLAGLVRARTLQEDAAKSRLARARARVRTATERARAQQDRVAGMTGEDPGEQSAQAFVAAAAARSAAAGTLAAALATAAEERADAERRRAELEQATVDRKRVEHLETHDLARVRAEDARREQHELDDLAATRHNGRDGEDR